MTVLGVARRAHQNVAKRHFQAGGSVAVSEHGHQTEFPVAACTTTHNFTTTSWDDLVADIRMWRSRYPNQRFYVVDWSTS